MKAGKRLMAFALCITLAGAASLTAAAESEEPGLNSYEEDGKNYIYYIDEDGNRLTGTWMTVGEYEYYFTDDGYAVSAVLPDEKDVRLGQNITLVQQEIDGKRYCFDQDGHKRSGILYPTSKDESGKRKGHFEAYDEDGVFDEELTEKLQEAAVYESDSAAIRELLSDLTPEKTEEGNSCYPPMPEGTDIIVYYDAFIVNYCKDKAGETEVFLGAVTR